MAQRSGGWDLEADVVAVGSGAGGLVSAITAHDLGKRVVVLEKAPKLGGVAAYSGGEVFVPGNHKMAERGLADSAEDSARYLEFLAAGYADPELQGVLLETGARAVEYLEREAGVRWKIVEKFPDYYFPHAPGTLAQGRYLEVELFRGPELGRWQQRTIQLSPHMPPGVTHDEIFGWGGLCRITDWDFELVAQRIAEDWRGLGPGLMGYLVKAAIVDRGIPAHCSTPVRELLVEDATVVGVRAERDGRDFRVRGREGVILAIGGYDWNRELVAYHEQLPEWSSSCPPFVEGDNLVMGGEIGAALAAVPPFNLGLFFGYHLPGEQHEGKPLYRASFEGGCPHALWVNRAGRRFCDESFYREHLPKTRQWDGLSQSQPHFPPYLIFDQSFRERYAFGPFVPGLALPEDLVATADTPRGLAAKLGVDAEGLASTIERFNELAAEGTDPDFGRGSYPWAAMMMGDRRYPNPNLAPLEKPPYHGVRLVPVGLGINSAGLKTNRNAQVVHVRGHPIAGLYAVGNSAAPLDTGAGYQSGLANLRGITWGFVAAHHLCRTSGRS